MREHIELVYTLQKIVEKGIVYVFSQIILRAIFFNIGEPKYRISVFYMREHMELVYIFQKRVE